MMLNVAFSKLTEELQKIKQLVKCPVCLETIRNPVKTGCSHIFCRECLQNHEEDSTKGKDIVCPICRTVINRRQKREYKNAEAVAYYVRNVEDILGRSRERSPLEELQVNLNFTASKRKPKDVQSTPKRKNAVTKKSNSSKKKSNQIKATTNRAETDFEYIELLKSPEEIHVNKVKDAFDLLKESSGKCTSLKSKTVKTYKGRKGRTPKKKNQQPIIYDRIFEFEDNENKIRILQWLNNNQNKFDRMTLTQTQDCDSFSESNSVCSFNLPSVSQINRNNFKTDGFNKYQIHETKQDQVPRIKRKLVEPHRRRAHSLDCCVKKIYPKSRLKRHTIACESQDYNIDIEHNSEEEFGYYDKENKAHNNQMWSLLEEECLKTIETADFSKLQAIENSTSNIEHQSRSKKRKRKQDAQNSKTETSGWKRMRALDRSTRKMKKLNITGSSTTKKRRKSVSNSKNINNNYSNIEVVRNKSDLNIGINEGAINEDKHTNKYTKDNFYYSISLTETDKHNNIHSSRVLEEKVEINKKQMDIRDSESVASYDLNLIENYLTKNIVKCIESGNQDVSNKVEIEELVPKRDNKICSDVNILPNNSVIIEKVFEKDSSTLKGTNTLIEKNQESLLIEHINEERNNTFLDSIENDTSDFKEGNKRSMSPLCHMNAVTSDNQWDDEELFLKPTQSALLDEVIGDKILNCSETHKKLQDLLDKLLNDITIHNQKQSEIDLNMFESTLIAIKCLIVNKNNYSFKQSDNVKNVHIQTEIIENFCDISIQTDFHKVESTFAQTDLTAGFYISSSETFKTPVKSSIAVQTDNVFCCKCKDSMQLNNNTQKSHVLNHSKTVDPENYVFTESFDRLDFDTQEIIKQGYNSVNTKQSNVTFLNKEHESSKLSSPLNNSQISQQSKIKVTVEIQPSRDSSSEQKITNRGLNETKSRYKRIRTFHSDSDSDTENSKQSKKICNNFLKEDLSINFESEAPPNILDEEQSKVAVLTSGSDEIDYEEFLNKVMKKYDDPSPEVRKISTKQSKAQEIIEKCEKLIKEAIELQPIPKPKEKSSNQTQVATKLSLQTIQEFEHEFYTEHKPDSDNVKTSPVCQPEEDKLSASLFENFMECGVSDKKDDDNNKDSKTKNIQLKTDSKVDFNRQELDKYVKEISDEFDHSFDAEINVELEAIHNQSQNKNGLDIKIGKVTGDRGISEKKITVLQDIVITKVPEEIAENLAEENRVLENINNENEFKSIDDSFEDFDNKSQKSDDIFISENDVIESTPPNASVPVESNEALSLDQEVINCLNTTFTPPPGFQDTKQDLGKVELQFTKNSNLTNGESQQNIDVVDLCSQTGKSIQRSKNVGISSLTPDLIFALNQPENDFPETSTPHMLESQNSHNPKPPNLSPIESIDNARPFNPISIVQATKFSPLTVVKPKEPQRTVSMPATSNAKQKSILNYVKTDDLNKSSSKISNLSQTSQRSISFVAKPCIACTRLNKNQVILINSLASKKLITYSGSFSESVTHMIVMTNEKNCVKDHTMKYILAVASGIWVLSFKWIEECLKKNSLIPEEPYEVLDVSGVAGPRRSRLAKNHNLFEGYKIYAAPPFTSTTQEEIQMVISMLGGKTVNKPNDLLPKDGSVPVIITEARASQDFEMYETWLETLRVVTVDIEWLSRSVGQYCLQSLRPFTLCSDDSIGELGYPSNLLIDVPISFTCNTTT